MKNISAKFIGLITGALMIGAALGLFYALHKSLPGRSEYVFWSLYTAGIIWSLTTAKTRIDEFNFKSFFSEGFKTFIPAAFMFIVYIFIFFKFHPQIMEGMISANNVQALKEGNHTPAEVTQNGDAFRKIFMPAMLMTNTLIYLVIGSLVSAIGAGFLSQRHAVAE